MQSWAGRKTAAGLVAALALAVTGLTWAIAAPASAAPLPAPITDYANYPTGIQPPLIPDGCSAPYLTGLSFRVRGVSSPSLSSFTFLPGDAIHMSWTGYAPGCEGLGVSLAIKRADTPVFDPSVNQELIVFDYCGPLGETCGNSGGHLRVTMQPRAQVCNWQIDAVVGPPLAVVGPDGSYYNNAARGDNGPNMLLAASNGGGFGTDCGAPSPVATATLSCADGGVVVTLGNEGEVDAPFLVTADGDEVFADDLGPGASQTVLVPVAENATVHVTVTSGSSTLVDDDFTQDCLSPPGPGASVTTTCAAGSVLTLTNTGEEPVTFTITDTRPGVSASEVEVQGGGTETVEIPLAEGETATVVVTAPGFDESFDVSRDCERPAAAFSISCATAGSPAVLATLSNTGEVPSAITVLKNGLVVETVTVNPNETVTRTYPMGEDETATFRATAPDFDSGDITGTADCLEIGGTETDRGGPAILPVTGPQDIGGMLRLALVLVAAGFVLLLASVGLRPSPAPIPVTAGPGVTDAAAPELLPARVLDDHAFGFGLPGRRERLWEAWEQRRQQRWWGDRRSRATGFVRPIFRPFRLLLR